MIAHRALGYRQTQVLALVQLQLRESGFAPSYREICNALGISTKGEVAEIVGGLERRGLVSRVGRGRVRRIAL